MSTLAQVLKNPPAPDTRVSVDVYAQTVQTFSGIVGRNLVLRRAKNTFRTNGSVIQVDPDHPMGYRILEHEIAHILFKSDALARNAFVSAYAKSVSAAFVKAGLVLDEVAFANFMQAVIGHLEDRRVNSLWANLYPGSARLLQDWTRADCAKLKSRVGNMDLLLLLAEREVDFIRPQMSASEAQVAALFSTAYRMVDRRGFEATLIASRWLLTQLVSFFAMTPQQRQQQQQSQQGKGGTKGQPGAQGQPGGQQGGAQDAPDSGDQDGADQDTQGQDGESDQEEQGNAEGGEEPPPPPMSAEDRVRGMQDLLTTLSTSNEPKANGLTRNDFEPSSLTSKAAEIQTARMVQDVLRKALGDADDANAQCEGSAEAMQQIVDTVRDSLGLSTMMDRDDWLRHDLKAQINFTDIKPSECDAYTLTAEQRLTVQRLRAYFMRVIGARTTALDDAGSEIDVRAYIDRKVTNEPIPFFKSETSGRGFRALIVLDRSGSMGGFPHHQVNLACQMLAAALNFPFVKLDVWGFNSPSDGVVKISRFGRGTKGFQSEKSSSSGLTPLHVATQLAIRELMHDSDVRHLFMLTDGQPEFVALQGGRYSHEAMLDMTRKGVLLGKRHGVNTTGVVLGSGVETAKMNHMFLHERQWHRFDESDRFCSDLFQLVVRNFGAYLRNR